MRVAEACLAPIAIRGTFDHVQVIAPNMFLSAAASHSIHEQCLRRRSLLNTVGTSCRAVHGVLIGCQSVNRIFPEGSAIVFVKSKLVELRSKFTGFHVA